MQRENIFRANEINKELNALNYFIDNINSRWEQSSMVLKVENKYSYKIFGSRYFGGGTHEQLIKVPSKLIDKVVAEASLIVNELENELKDL